MIMFTRVLDQGYVELINHTPNGDLLVVNAARTSFDKQHDEFDTQKDTKLIQYLARHGHVLPFRHPSCTLRLHAPIFVLRQLGKHQVGFSWSEVSRRYISSEPTFYTPDRFRAAPEGSIKQGSVDNLQKENQEKCIEAYTIGCRTAVTEYNRLLELGAAPEMARAVLPQSMYTTTVTTGTLLGWHHLYKLRTEDHTQIETQMYAKVIGGMLQNIFPVSWDALCQHS